MEWLDLLQWPAMIVTVIAAWFTGSQRKLRRMLGFWCFLASNVLWGIWGWHQRAWAMIILQLALAAMNIRGVNKNEPEEKPEASERATES
jgi:hypothetical protein